MQFQWYPGHMTKARRQMEQDIKLVDLVIELLDARVPMASRNPEIDNIAKNKYRLVLLTKSDLADNGITAAWIRYFKEKNILAISLDARGKNGLKAVNDAILEACKEKLERDKRRGILNRPIRAMVVGIPNVGKSTFINSFAGRASAKTGNKPGVTKGNQWIRLNKGVDLLDTPGILWPKFEDQTIGLHLAFIGSIKDDIINMEELAWELIRYFKEYYPAILPARYGIDMTEDANTDLQNIALVRKCMKKGAEPDTQKAALLIIDDFRSGKLGKISIERPEQKA